MSFIEFLSFLLPFLYYGFIWYIAEQIKPTEEELKQLRNQELSDD